MSAVMSTLPEGQFVTLGLDGEIFAVPVGMVREILDSRRITHLPESPLHVLGLIDVRGRSVPVVDLRAMLGLAETMVTEHTRILVLEISSEPRARILGLMVDRVFEVRALDSASLEAPPDFGGHWRSEHLLGIGRLGDDFVLLLDVERMFSRGASLSF